MSVIETERLILRRFTPEDAAENYRIYTDPENMRFMGRRPDSVEFERYYLRKHIEDYYERHGFGLWAAVLKEDGRLIGRCGLIYQQIEGTQEVEVSYLIDRHHWGKGLATEAAREVVRLGFEQYKLPRIVAVINPENVASVRVAEKAGLKYERDVNFKEFGIVSLYGVNAMTRIFHITSRAEADEAVRAGTYVAAGFRRDGFIHCSYARQLTRVADANFRGRSDLVLLEIDRARVGCEVIDENLEGGSDLFPHVYGPLPMSAVTAMVDFPCRPDGTFELPADVPA